MEQAPTGEQIVEGMAAGRAWWRLRACDIEPWVRSLPAAVRDHDWSRLAWIGTPWNGASDIDVGVPLWDGIHDEPVQPVMSGADAQLLVAELRRLIMQLPVLGIAPPDHRNVRSCLAGPEGDPSDPTTGTLTIDFDLGGIVVPLCIEDWQMRPDTSQPMTRVASLMLDRLAWAAKRRDALTGRELELRTAFESAMADIGDGAAPLWLRMEPLRYDDAPSNLAFAPYAALEVMLDHHQVWAPSGQERVGPVGALLKRCRGLKKPHRRRVARLAEMQSTRSAGWIGDVALALIGERGTSPADAFRSAKQAGLDGEGAEDWGRAGGYGALHCFDGVLCASFDFDGGRYFDGRLSLIGVFPETIAAAAKGRPLSAFVEHPAFVGSGAKVTRAELHDGRLHLYHTPRLTTVEEAELRWAEAHRRRPQGAGAGTTRSKERRLASNRGCECKQGEKA